MFVVTVGAGICFWICSKSVDVFVVWRWMSHVFRDKRCFLLSPFVCCSVELWLSARTPWTWRWKTSAPSADPWPALGREIWTPGGRRGGVGRVDDSAGRNRPDCHRLKKEKTPPWDSMTHFLKANTRAAPLWCVWQRLSEHAALCGVICRRYTNRSQELRPWGTFETTSAAFVSLQTLRICFCSTFL